jgi:hypothetical protein
MQVLSVEKDFFDNTLQIHLKMSPFLYAFTLLLEEELKQVFTLGYQSTLINSTNYFLTVLQS